MSRNAAGGAARQGLARDERRGLLQPLAVRNRRAPARSERGIVVPGELPVMPVVGFLGRRRIGEAGSAIHARRQRVRRRQRRAFGQNEGELAQRDRLVAAAYRARANGFVRAWFHRAILAGSRARAGGAVRGQRGQRLQRAIDRLAQRNRHRKPELAAGLADIGHVTIRLARRPRRCLPPAAREARLRPRRPSRPALPDRGSKRLRPTRR